MKFKMPVSNKEVSNAEKPKVHITSQGARRVNPFEIIRSKKGREAIERHTSNPEVKESRSTVKAEQVEFKDRKNDEAVLTLTAQSRT